MEEKKPHIFLTWHLKKMFHSIPVDFENIVFGGVLDFDYPMREHLNNKIRADLPRPKFTQEKMKPRVV